MVIFFSILIFTKLRRVNKIEKFDAHDESCFMSIVITLSISKGIAVGY